MKKLLNLKSKDSTEILSIQILMPDDRLIHPYISPSEKQEKSNAQPDDSDKTAKEDNEDVNYSPALKLIVVVPTSYTYAAAVRKIIEEVNNHYENQVFSVNALARSLNLGDIIHLGISNLDLHNRENLDGVSLEKAEFSSLVYVIKSFDESGVPEIEEISEDTFPTRLTLEGDDLVEVYIQRIDRYGYVQARLFFEYIMEPKRGGQINVLIDNTFLRVDVGDLEYAPTYCLEIED